jgi:hypothetical protein
MTHDEARVCAVCREPEPPRTGQSVGTWAALHRPGVYVICKRCRDAGRMARIQADVARLEAERDAAPALTAHELLMLAGAAEEYATYVPCDDPDAVLALAAKCRAHAEGRQG